MLWPVAMLGAYITGYDYLPYLGGYFCYFSAGTLFAILQTKQVADKGYFTSIDYLFCFMPIIFNQVQQY